MGTWEDINIQSITAPQALSPVVIKILSVYETFVDEQESYS